MDKLEKMYQLNLKIMDLEEKRNRIFNKLVKEIGYDEVHRQYATLEDVKADELIRQALVKHSNKEE